MAVERPVPEPGPGEIRVKVAACGVCRTDLHLAEGDLPPRRPGVIPGHEVVGRVDAVGPGATRFAAGRPGRHRLAAPHLRTLPLLPAGRGEPLPGARRSPAGTPTAATPSTPSSTRPTPTASPTCSTTSSAAPLLCAGIIGYRALRRAALPPGGRLGIYGFGGSAHLAAQVALAEGAAVHVMTRSAEARRQALELGAAWPAPGAGDAPPEPLDAAILFAPAGDVVPAALAALDRGGTLAVAGIHLSDIPPLDYERHLFQERQLRSVTANTRADGEDFLALAARLRLRVTVQPYPLDEAGRALADLAGGRVTGAAVLVP